MRINGTGKLLENYLAKFVIPKLKKEEALDAIDQALFCLNNFLTGMERVYC